MVNIIEVTTLNRATRRAGRWFALMILALSCLALSSCASTTPENQAPPDGAVTATLILPEPETEIVTVTTDSDGERKKTYTVLADDSQYNGEPTLRFHDGVDTQVLNATNRNWMVTVAADDDPLTSADPDTGRYNWPLWVGKSWKSSYKYTDHERGRSWSPVSDYWEVTAHEEVTVPAGTFKTMVLTSRPANSNSAVKRTIWYAYEAGLQIKQRYERTSRHYRGPYKSETVVESIGQPDE